MACRTRRHSEQSAAMSKAAKREERIKIKPLKQAKEDFMRAYLHSVLLATEGHTAAAARMIGWTVPNFCKLLRKYEIIASAYRVSVYLREYHLSLRSVERTGAGKGEG